jgi:hypothetical protein
VSLGSQDVEVSRISRQVAYDGRNDVNPRDELLLERGENILSTHLFLDGMAQSLQLLATGWTVRGSNPGVGGDFSDPSRPALGPSQPPVQ